MVENLIQEIDDISGFINTELEVASAPTTDAVMDRVDDIASDLEEIRKPNAYEDYLIDYLSVAKDEFEDGGWTSEHDDEDRLCTCSNPYCALKRGELPPEVMLADSLDRGIMRYKTGHSGTPVVLLDARSSFLEAAYSVKRRLNRTLVMARRDAVGTDDAVDSNPDSDDTEGTADA